VGEVKTLWLVIYQTGLIGGTVGPLPYEIEQCKERAAEMQAKADFKSIPLRFSCEFHFERPKISPDLEAGVK
jgi:hypothetical protein